MSILKRTVYYDNTGGRAMFWDFATVTTTQGTMVEPFNPGTRYSPNEDFDALDPDDEVNRIDEIRAAPLDKSQLILSDDHCQGGILAPRVGR